MTKRLKKLRLRARRLARRRFPWLSKLRPVNLEAAIQRSFQTLEMLLVSVLVGVVGSIVENWSLIGMMYTLQFAAGLYFAIPIVRWLMGPIRFEFLPIIFTVQIAVGVMVLADPLLSLAKATIDVDVEQARRNYDEVRRREHFYGCARRGVPIEECSAGMRYN